MDLYREAILDHYKHPRHFGHLEGAHVASEQVNVSCGDKITMEVRLEGQGADAVVSDIRFSGEGCAINQASASMLTEKALGMRVDDIMNLALSDIETMLGTTLTPSRVKCAVLPLEALQTAIKKL